MNNAFAYDKYQKMIMFILKILGYYESATIILIIIVTVPSRNELVWHCKDARPYNDIQNNKTKATALFN